MMIDCVKMGYTGSAQLEEHKMAQRERSSSRDVKTRGTRTGKDACPPRGTAGLVVVRSVKTGQFTRSEIKKVIRKVTSGRTTGCHPA